MKTLFVLGAIFTSLIAMSCSNQESLDGMLTESQSLQHPIAMVFLVTLMLERKMMQPLLRINSWNTQQAEEYNMKQLIFIIQMGRK